MYKSNEGINRKLLSIIFDIKVAFYLNVYIRISSHKYFLLTNFFVWVQINDMEATDSNQADKKQNIHFKRLHDLITHWM